MARRSIRDETPRVDAECAQALGDMVTYAGVTEPFPVQGDFGDTDLSLGPSNVVDQAIILWIRKVDVPGRPGDSDRLTLALHPGITFKPTNVGNDASATHWQMNLKRVP